MQDQPAPQPGKEDVALYALGDFVTMFVHQVAKGAQKYGTGLQTHNGRNPYKDAWQEYVDQGMYFKQAEKEHEDLVMEFAGWQKVTRSFYLALLQQGLLYEPASVTHGDIGTAEQRRCRFCHAKSKPDNVIHHGDDCILGRLERLLGELDS